MNQRTKDVFIIPCVITLVGGFLFMVWGAWYSGVKLHSPFSAFWLHAVFTATIMVPMWFAFVLVVLFIIAVVGNLSLRQENGSLKAQCNEQSIDVTVTEFLKNKNLRLEQKIEELRSTEPKLHGVWNPSQAFWHMGRKAEDPSMQIGGWISLSTSNTNENLHLLAAYIGECRADTFVPVSVKPNFVQDVMVMLFFTPPLSDNPDKPFTATIVLEDHHNRRYELPHFTFRATASQQPLPALPNPAVPIPILHASWSGDSCWGWASSRFVDDGFRTYMIKGDVTLLLDYVTEAVTIIGVEIEGAEPMGKFDNFTLNPSSPDTRFMRLYFRGKAPENNDHYTVRLVFVDLRGNKYPIEPHRFNPLPILERVAIERGHKPQ